MSILTGVGAHQGRVAVVTGAASGIGRATVERLVAEGACVVAVDRAQSLSWAESNARIAICPGDVTDEACNANAVQSATERFGRLDTLVCNAGIAMSGDLLSMPMSQFDRVMDVNVRAVVLGVRAAVPAMKAAGGGSIVVTASTSGTGGDPGMWPYNTSKAAVINLVRALALDLGIANIRVNAVCPGPTETGMTQGIQSVPAVYESLRSRIALQRWGQSHEIAAAISFLASADAGFITGVSLPVDGGMTASTGQFLPPHRQPESDPS